MKYKVGDYIVGGTDLFQVKSYEHQKCLYKNRIYYKHVYTIYSFRYKISFKAEENHLMYFTQDGINRLKVKFL